MDFRMRSSERLTKPSIVPSDIHSQHSNTSTNDDSDHHRQSTSQTRFGASQTLGSVGAPSSHSGNITSFTESEAQSSAILTEFSELVNGSNQIKLVHPLFVHPVPAPVADLPSVLPETPTRALPYPYQSQPPLPLHSGNAMDPHHYPSTPQYNSGEGLSIQLQQATPHYSSTSAGSTLPGALQPGPHNRPTSLSSATVPSNVPTLPQLSTQMQQTPQNVRSAPLNHSHNYSRSSPAGIDQARYKSYNATPEGNKYNSPNPSFAAQLAQSGSYSPLGLADIRPHTHKGLADGPLSPNMMSDVETPRYPTNSNYLTPWPIYAVDWCKFHPKQNSSHAGKIALGSYLEDNHNYIQILEAQRTQSDLDDPNSDRGFEFTKIAEATHSYPVTRILWEPLSGSKTATDLLATSGDHLRLWSLPQDKENQIGSSINRSSQPQEPPVKKLSPLALLSNSKSPEHTAPITSLDWNVVSPSLIITSSIDTTCTIWDIPSLTAKTQLIAHDKEVFDVRFCAQSVDVFVSCGADGSVRMFDLRSLEHSTIIYEPSEKNDKSAQLNSPASHSPTTPGGLNPSSSSSFFPAPLLRIAASPHDAHLLATISTDSPTIRILDVRQPGQALLELRGHAGAVNSIEWSPNRRGFLASGADDSMVLIWDLMTQAGAVVPPNQVGKAQQQSQPAGERGPCAAWSCEHEVSNLSWAPGTDTIGVCGGRGFWGVQM